VDPIGPIRLVAQYGVTANPRGVSDAAAAQAGADSQFEKVRRERNAQADITVRAVQESEAAESKVLKKDERRGSRQGRGQSGGRRGDQAADAGPGKLVDYSA
jgi:hypothetical protein